MNKFQKFILKKTPFSVTILGGLALIFMALNTVRFGVALVEWDLLLEFMPQPGPIYIAATGLWWALCWLAVFLGIELARKWSRVAFLLISFLYASYYWIDRFLFQPHAERSNTIFVFIATFFSLVLIVIILALPKSRAYFEEKSDKGTA